MSDQPVPTQSQHPWRATFRTVAAAAIALIPVLPVVLDSLGVSALPWAAGFIAAIGAVTRVLAIPSVIEWLRTYVPGLAPTPNDKA
jgi:hypothetical protein